MLILYTRTWTANMLITGPRFCSISCTSGAITSRFRRRTRSFTELFRIMTLTSSRTFTPFLPAGPSSVYCKRKIKSNLIYELFFYKIQRTGKNYIVNFKSKKKNVCNLFFFYNLELLPVSFNIYSL